MHNFHGLQWPQTGMNDCIGFLTLPPIYMLLLLQIFQLLRTRKSHGVSLDDLLSLMVFAASLGGPEVFSQRDEYALINLLSHALVEDKDELSDLILELG